MAKTKEMMFRSADLGCYNTEEEAVKSNVYDAGYELREFFMNKEGEFIGSDLILERKAELLGIMNRMKRALAGKDITVFIEKENR